MTSRCLRSSRFAFPALALFTFLLGACTSPSAQPAPTASPASAASEPQDEIKPFTTIIKGMTTAEVRARLGPPASVKAFAAEGITGEIWTYTVTTRGPVRQVAAEMQEVPYIDPIDGSLRMIKEPLTKTEFTRIHHTFELLMIRDLFVESKHLVTSTRDIR